MKKTNIQGERIKAAMAGTYMQKEMCTITLSQHLKSLPIAQTFWSDFRVGIDRSR